MIPTDQQRPAGDGGDEPPTEDKAAKPAPVLRLSAELDLLLRTFAERAVTLREMLEVLHGRGYNLLLILLAFPFCTPIPLPGVSTPFGLAIAFIGLRLALGQKPWLPDRVLDRKLPPRFLPTLLGAAKRLVRGLEFFLRPRFMRVMRWRPVDHAMGAMICVSGLLLLLPLPIPFSNFLPAITVVLLAAAMLENDGCCAVAGGGMFVFTLIFFGALFWGGTEAVGWLEERFGGVMVPDYEQPAPP